MLNSLWPMECRTPDFPVLHYLLEFAQIPVHWVCDAIHRLSAISSSVTSFFPWLQSFTASWSFPMCQLFESGIKSIGGSASASVLTMNIQGWLPFGLTGLISLQSKGLLQHHSSKATILQHLVFFMAQISLQYMITGKTIVLPSCQSYVSAFSYNI